MLKNKYIVIAKGFDLNYDYNLVFKAIVFKYIYNGNCFKFTIPLNFFFCKIIHLYDAIQK